MCARTHTRRGLPEADGGRAAGTPKPGHGTGGGVRAHPGTAPPERNPGQPATTTPGVGPQERESTGVRGAGAPLRRRPGAPAVDGAHERWPPRAPVAGVPGSEGARGPWHWAARRGTRTRDADAEEAGRERGPRGQGRRFRGPQRPLCGAARAPRARSARGASTGGRAHWRHGRLGAAPLDTGARTPERRTPGARGWAPAAQNGDAGPGAGRRERGRQARDQGWQGQEAGGRGVGRDRAAGRGAERGRWGPWAGGWGPSPRRRPGPSRGPSGEARGRGRRAEAGAAARAEPLGRGPSGDAGGRGAGTPGARAGAPGRRVEESGDGNGGVGAKGRRGAGVGGAGVSAGGRGAGGGGTTPVRLLRSSAKRSAARPRL